MVFSARLDFPWHKRWMTEKNNKCLDAARNIVAASDYMLEYMGLRTVVSEGLGVSPGKHQWVAKRRGVEWRNKHQFR